MDYVYKLSNTFNFSAPTVTFIDFHRLSLRDGCNTSWVASSSPIAVWSILNRVVNRSSLNQVNHLNLLLGMFQGLPFAFSTTSKFVDMMYKAHRFGLCFLSHFSSLLSCSFQLSRNSFFFFFILSLSLSIYLGQLLLSMSLHSRCLHK